MEKNYWIELIGFDKDDIKATVEDFIDKQPENLSGGQKQRVAIAGVLAMQPELIIFDEATSMLDPKGKSEVREVINEMRKANPNLAIISITHDIEEAFSSDEIIVLNKGKIVLDGTPEEVLNKKQVLLDAGLDIPFKTKFLDLLKDKGVELKITESLEGMIEELCR